MLTDIEAILKRFDEADELRTFEKGKFEIVHIGGLTIGRPLTSLAGNGPKMLVPLLPRRGAKSSMSD